jgi:hypothetical protein
MNVFNWLTGRFSCRGKAVSLYKRGMTKAKKHDFQAAINDYTESIGLPNTPADLKAMVLYNRALAHVATGDYVRGVDDLEALLAMDGASPAVKSRARHKLARRRSRSHKANV